MLKKCGSFVELVRSDPKLAVKFARWTDEQMVEMENTLIQSGLVVRVWVDGELLIRCADQRYPGEQPDDVMAS